MLLTLTQEFHSEQGPFHIGALSTSLQLIMFFLNQEQKQYFLLHLSTPMTGGKED